VKRQVENIWDQSWMKNFLVDNITIGIFLFFLDILVKRTICMVYPGSGFIPAAGQKISQIN
jgi:hypothetical protein